MNVLPAAALFAALSVVCARADLTITQSIEGGGPMNAMTIKVKGDKARIDATPQLITIVDSASGDILTLMMDQKKFMRIPASQAKAAAEMAMPSADKSAPVVKAQLKPTGKKETINGYETEEYVCEAPSFKGSYWISTKYPDSAAILKQLQATAPQTWNTAGKGMPDYRDFPGLPLRSQVTFSGREITTTLVSIKQDPLPASEFVIPAGFEEMKMPDMSALMGGKPPAPQAAPSPKS